MVQFNDSFTLEQACQILGVSKILVSPSRRIVMGPDGNPVKNEDGSNKLTYLKHQSGIQKYFLSIPAPLAKSVDFPGVRKNGNTYQWFAAVSEKIARDLETNGTLNPDKVAVLQEIQRDNEEPVLTLVYQGDSQSTVLFSLE